MAGSLYWFHKVSLTKFNKKYCRIKNLNYLCSHNRRKYRAISSAGSEHLPYKQGVGGSNPSSPTGNQPLTE